jgi:hypothetical protein
VGRDESAFHLQRKSRAQMAKRTFENARNIPKHHSKLKQGGLMMIEKLFNSQRLLMSSMIFLMALLATGCTTTFLEYSGRMANQGSSNHVKPYQGASTQNNSGEAVRPIVHVATASQISIRVNETN